MGGVHNNLGISRGVGRGLFLCLENGNSLCGGGMDIFWNYTIWKISCHGSCSPRCNVHRA